MNAIRRWTRDGPEGKQTGCIEVQIAVITERLRGYVLHMRENPKDFIVRNRMVSLVARRRNLLDGLAWRDLPSYIKVRDELKIRHTYRIEALVGRLGSYKYTEGDRPKAPGRKTVMRMRKSQKLLSQRLARKLRQGRPGHEIFFTRKAMQKRRFTSRAIEDTFNMIKGKETTRFIDPLNLP